MTKWSCNDCTSLFIHNGHAYCLHKLFSKKQVSAISKTEGEYPEFRLWHYIKNYNLRSGNGASWRLYSIEDIKLAISLAEKLNITKLKEFV